MSASPDRFIALAGRLGAAADPGAVAADLLSRWAEPARVYHSRRHLDDCLAQLDAAPVHDLDRDLVETALWFHDAVYDPHQSDNERQSADLARDQLTDIGVPSSRAERVAALVLLTGHGERPMDPEGRLVCDIDLSILGRPAGEFERYDREISAEYCWVPEVHYRRERATVLNGFLQRDPLYLIPWFRERYQDRARNNLRAAIARLQRGDGGHNDGAI